MQSRRTTYGQGHTWHIMDGWLADIEIRITLRPRHKTTGDSTWTNSKTIDEKTRTKLMKLKKHFWLKEGNDGQMSFSCPLKGHFFLTSRFEDWLEPESFESLILIDSRTDWFLQREKFKSLRDLRIQNFWSHGRPFKKHLGNSWSYRLTASKPELLWAVSNRTIRMTTQLEPYLTKVTFRLFWRDTFVYSILTDLLFNSMDFLLLLLIAWVLM